MKDVPVIDIGADTPVLALDSSGAVGKGTLHEAVGRCSNIVDFPYTEQGDWWRIANINFCGVGIICISELWTQSPPRPVVLGVVLDAYPGGNDTNNNGIKVLAGKSNRISKIRFVVDVRNKANSGWLDICIPHTDKFKSRRTQIASYGLGIRPVKLAEAPSVDNAYFVKEFDMTALQSNSGGVISCTAIGPYLVAYKEKGGPHEYGREKVFGNTIARRSLSDTWSVLGWLGGKSACVGVNDVQRKSLGLKRCLGSDRAVSSEHRVSELSTWNNAKPFGRDTVSERDSVWHSSVVRNEYAKQHSCAHKNRIFIQRLVSSDHDILAGKEVAA